MTAHIADLLGAWALDVCDDAETATVEAHLRQCPECASEARRLRSSAALLGIEKVMNPPARLRQSVLDTARRRRPPAVLRTLIGAYAGQVDLLDRALRDLGTIDWQHPDPRHGDLAGLVRHLTGNDAMLAADLALPVVRISSDQVHPAWRAQAQSLISGLGDDENLERTVSLAGRGGPSPGPLRHALVQRAFETWIHLDDIRAYAGRGPAVPPPEQVRRIVGLAVALLPAALAPHGLVVPGSSRLILTGPAGGEWDLPFGRFTIRADAVEFARLVANRRAPETLMHTVEGDRRLAAQVLRIASTLGCD